MRHFISKFQMSIDNCKFQFVEQLKAAVSIFGDGCSCIDVILGLWVVLFNGSILVVQTGRNPCKEWYKAAYSGFRYLLQILPWQTNRIFTISNNLSKMLNIFLYYWFFFTISLILIWEESNIFSLPPQIFSCFSGVRW